MMVARDHPETVVGRSVPFNRRELPQFVPKGERRPVLVQSARREVDVSDVGAPDLHAPASENRLVSGHCRDHELTISARGSSCPERSTIVRVMNLNWFIERDA